MKSWRVLQVVGGKKEKNGNWWKRIRKKKGDWKILSGARLVKTMASARVGACSYSLGWGGGPARHGTARMVWLRAAVLHGSSGKGEEFWYCANSSTRLSSGDTTPAPAPHRCLLFFFPFSLCFKQINSKYLKLFFKVEMTFPLGSFAFSKNLQKLVNFYNVSRYFHFAPRWKSRTCPS